MFHGLTPTGLEGLVRCRLDLSLLNWTQRYFMWSCIEILEDQVLEKGWFLEILKQKASPGLCWLGAVSCGSWKRNVVNANQVILGRVKCKSKCKYLLNVNVHVNVNVKFKWQQWYLGTWWVLYSNCKVVFACITQLECEKNLNLRSWWAMRCHLLGVMGMQCREIILRRLLVDITMHIFTCRCRHI